MVQEKVLRGAMFFQQLLTQVKFKYVLAELVTSFPDQEKNKDGYQFLYQKLLSLKAKPSTYQLYVERCFDEFAGHYFHASYIDLTENALDENSTTYALSCCAEWDVITGMELKVDDNVSLVQAIAAVFFEMTFFGWGEYQVSEKLNSILND